MPQADEPTTSMPKPSAAEGRKSKATASPSEQTRPDLFALTIDVARGRIVTLERVDEQGSRQQISADERSRLAKTQSSQALMRLVEEAFEAGIACVLGEEDESDPEESKADDELSRMLLRSLIERSKARYLIEGDTLDRAIVGSLIGRAAASASP